MPEVIPIPLEDRLREIVGANSRAETCRILVDRFLPEARRFQNAVNVEWVCSRKKIPIIMHSKVPFQGRLTRDSDANATIGLRQFADYEELQRRFTLAHELGHWIIQEALGEFHETLFRGMPVVDNARADEEDIADTIASEIILPCERMAEFVAAGLSFETIQNGQSRFRVGMHTFLRQFSICSRREVLCLIGMPRFFPDLNSRFTIDDAFYWYSDVGMLRNRDLVAMLDFVAFCDAADRAKRGLRVSISGSRAMWKFDARNRLGSVPTLTLVSDSRQTEICE